MPGDSRRLIRLIVVFSVAALAVLALLIVVGTVGGQDTISETPPSDSGNPVIPPADSTVSRSREVQLYFRFGSEGYLACETRLIEVRASERLEAAVLRELIRGPSSEHAELTRLIQAQTQIGEITEQGDTLYVTLSADFLRSAVNQPEGWGEDAALVRENFLQRRLAVYSVVNTLSNLGTYSHVQILVDSEGEGVGELLPRRPFGFVDDAASKEKPLPPLPYEDSVVLDAENTVACVLQALVEKNWSSAYAFVAGQNESGIIRPLYDTAAANLQRFEIAVQSYEIVGSAVSHDGQSSVVRADIEYRRADGSTVKRESYPVRLLLHGEIWKLDYERLLSLLSLSN